jgi:tRNA(Ile)-lysidine synthase
LEQNARNERYDFLGKTAENVKAFAVLTGHTINDQAETFLLNLIRGSGTRGLSGMRPIRKLRASASAETVLVRPLLDWAYRQDTEQFCHDLGVEYRYDTMNEDEAFKRVRIRKVLLPLLEDFNPRIVDRLADTARLLQVRSIDEAPEIDASDLSLAEINSLEKPVLYTTIRSWIEANRGNLRQIGLKHIEAIDRLIHSRKSGRTVELPGGATVEKKAGRLTFRKN